MGIKCFWLEPTGQRALYLRRFVFSDHGICVVTAMGTHNASVRIEDEPIEYDGEPDEWGHRSLSYIEPSRFADDQRWPTHCECGYEFTPSDEWQVSQDLLRRRSDTGEVIPLRDLPPGAIFDAEWLRGLGIGPDGKSLIAILPNGKEWFIDGQANNCTMPDDFAQKQHHCWVRHGDVPNITVNKNGVTCGAGAGSIQAGDYHGFLINGEFQP